jgi:hypothetical protein
MALARAVGRSEKGKDGRKRELCTTVIRDATFVLAPSAGFSPGALAEPLSPSIGFGLRLIAGSVNFAISVPRASAFDSRGTWLRNSETIEDVLHVGRKAVKVRLEIGL